MTQAEFEALQVGDVIASDQNDLAVMYDVIGEHEKRFVFQDDGIDGSIWHDELEDWTVVSRVLSRESIPVKGGE